MPRPNPAPAAFDDSYAGLAWAAAHAAELGFDPGRLAVAGGSAGGGLAAALALKARDAGGPALAGQLLMYPVLDDRNDTLSSRQLDGVGLWDRTSNETAWNASLGDRRGTDRVSAYEAPSRAADLSGLPPAYIEAGSAEVFRDESVRYASGIWAAGEGPGARSGLVPAAKVLGLGDHEMFSPGWKNSCARVVHP